MVVFSFVLVVMIVVVILGVFHGAQGGGFGVTGNLVFIGIAVKTVKVDREIAAAKSQSGRQRVR